MQYRIRVRTSKILCAKGMFSAKDCSELRNYILVPLGHWSSDLPHRNIVCDYRAKIRVNSRLKLELALVTFQPREFAAVVLVASPER